MQKWNGWNLRLLPVCILAVFVACVGGERVHAQNQAISLTNFGPFPPKSFTDVKNELSQLSSTLSSSAQCGGWSLSESVAPLPAVSKNDWFNGQPNSGKISWVEGVPGRRGIPLGNWDSGMAWRVEQGDPNGDGMSQTGFTYPAGTNPQNTRSLATSCPTGASQLPAPVKVWCYKGFAGQYVNPANLEGQGPPSVSPPRNCDLNVSTPYYEDSACLWKNGVKEDKPYSENGCMDFCTNANDPTKYAFPDCKETELRTRTNAAGNEEKYVACKTPGLRWACSGDWVQNPSTDPHTTENKNCRVCLGGDCRCPGPACDKQGYEAPTGQNGNVYQSFYRHYDAHTTREKVGNVQSDVLSNVNAEVSCYGLYSEYDPRDKVAPAPPACVIGNITTADGAPFDANRMKQTQTGKGDFRAPSGPDTLPAARPYDASRDMWYIKILGAFSFLKPGQDLAQGILNPDLATVVATVQRTISQPFAKYGLIRSTDDTVHNDATDTRAFTSWWQQMGTNGHLLFSPASITLRLPATWRASVADLAPTEVTQEGDPRTAPIDVQIEAKDDLLGRVVSYLSSQMRLNVQEQPVPIIIPSNSPIELRAAAERWRTWKQEQTSIGNPVPAEVDGLIAKLEKYAQDIEKVRLTQSELSRLLSGLLTRQRDFLVGVNDWAERNTDAYDKYVEQAKTRDSLQGLWQNVNQTAATFSDQTNLPWCRSDRFTTPIYSLLDSWYPPKSMDYPQNLTAGIPSCTDAGMSVSAGKELPTLCLPEQRDLVVDFSLMKTFTGAILLPVLAPVQVRLNVPLPGSTTLTLPDFPDVPDFSETITTQFPDVQVRSAPPDLQVPPDADLNRARVALLRTFVMLHGMDTTYKQFWDSFTYNPQTQPTFNGKSLGPLDCWNMGDARCSQNEMDLLERLTRFTARPAVLLKEDLQTQGVARVNLPAVKSIPGMNEGDIDVRKDAVCTADDHVCQALLPELTLPQSGWQVKYTSTPTDTTSAVADMRAKARAFTLKPDGTVIGNPPLPFAVPAVRLTPVYDVAPNTTLSPHK